METLGLWLRQAREAKGSTLEEVEAATRIRPRFLEALEAGNFAAFPGGAVQARGFLRIYARYLDLSPEEALARYDAEVYDGRAPAETRPAPARPVTARPVTYQPQSISVSASQSPWMNQRTLMIVSLVLIPILAIVTVVGYFLSQNGSGAADATATIAATAPVEGEGVLTSTDAPPPLDVTPTFPVNPQGEVTLALEATEHVWVRVIQDDQTAFEALMAPGQTETWSGQQVIVVETGNGAALLVTVNGQAQGAMCGRAQTCTRAWSALGEVAVP
jgi:cytoskeleton protein RodZ